MACKKEDEAIRVIHLSFPALVKNPFLTSKLRKKTMSTNIESISHMHVTRQMRGMPTHTGLPCSASLTNNVSDNVKI